MEMSISSVLPSFVVFEVASLFSLLPPPLAIQKLQLQLVLEKSDVVSVLSALYSIDRVT